MSLVFRWVLRGCLSLSSRHLVVLRSCVYHTTETAVVGFLLRESRLSLLPSLRIALFVQLPVPLTVPLAVPLTVPVPEPLVPVPLPTPLPVLVPVLVGGV